MDKATLKHVADALTTSRLFIALFIMVIAQYPGSAVMVSLLVFANMCGWTTDVLDGRLARKSGQPEGRIGKCDLIFDTALQWGSLYAISRWGYIPFAVFCLYALFGLFLVFILGWKKELISVVSFPGLIGPYIVSYLVSPVSFYIYSAWVMLALLLDWKRFAALVEAFFKNFPTEVIQPVRNYLKAHFKK